MFRMHVTTLEKLGIIFVLFNESSKFIKIVYLRVVKSHFGKTSVAAYSFSFETF